MKFKVGDRVKILYDFTWKRRGEIGHILSFDWESGYCWVLFAAGQGDYPYIYDELELAIKPGEQLEFSFMKKD